MSKWKRRSEGAARMQSADYGTDYGGPIFFGAVALLVLGIGVVRLRG